MVTGDAINVAARLQTSAEPGRVLVGDRTFRSTQSLFRFGDPVELTLKGKAAPVTAHPLVGRIEGALEAGPARNVQARVVGRVALDAAGGVPRAERVADGDDVDIRMSAQNSEMG